MPPPGKLDGELGVLISLVVSLGMAILTVTGWWLVNTFQVSWERSCPCVPWGGAVEKEKGVEPVNTVDWNGCLELCGLLCLFGMPG